MSRFSAGQIIGDYRVVEVLGAGGMGAVYKVQHLISDRLEAIKTMLPDLAGSGDLAERFVREIRVQARLSHPNIAALHNALRFDNQLLMVMEYVDGVPLSSRLRHGKIDAAISIEIALQVLVALGYAHTEGVVHRDIKPANIMIAAGGIVKLMDFGIARSAADAQITSSGTAIGSLHYMSPEQVRSETADRRSDLYSLGVVLYEMVSGHRPIVGTNSWEIMNAHLHQIPTPLWKLEPLLPGSLDAVVMRAIEKDPARRFQNALEFSEHLSVVRNSIGNAASSSEALKTLVSVPAPVQREEPHATVTPITPGLGSAIFRREDLDLVKRQLAVHIGPVARIVVDRAAKRVRTLRELYETVASEIPAGKERQLFLSQRTQ